MLMSVTNDESHCIVRLLEAKLDSLSAVKLKQLIKTEISSGHDNIIIDLSSVTFIDSSGVAALIEILKSIPLQGSLSITGLNKKTQKIFKKTRIDTLLTLYPSVQDALGKVSRTIVLPDL